MKLIVNFNNGQEQTFSIVDRSVVVGRGSEAKLVFADEQLSRKHCLIEDINGQIVISDLESANGTFVNGARIPPHVPTPLRERDVVSIGDLLIGVDLRSAPLSAPNLKLQTLTGIPVSKLRMKAALSGNSQGLKAYRRGRTQALNEEKKSLLKEPSFLLILVALIVGVLYYQHRMERFRTKLQAPTTVESRP